MEGSDEDRKSGAGGDSGESGRAGDDSGSGRNEPESERLDRNVNELLQELRVTLPGVQVLFAFLLAVPFQQGFSRSRLSRKSSTSACC